MKKIIHLFLALALIITVVGCSSSSVAHDDTQNDSSPMWKVDWLLMMGQAFIFNYDFSYEYGDVEHIDNGYLPLEYRDVSAIIFHNSFPDQESLKEELDKEYIAETYIRYFYPSVETDSYFEESKSMGLFDNGEATDKVNYGEAKKILSRMQDLFLKDEGDSYSNIEIRDDVVFIDSEMASRVQINDDTVIIPNDLGLNYSLKSNLTSWNVYDILFIELDDGVFISRIDGLINEGDNTIVYVSSIESLDEVFDTFSFHGYGSPSIDDITLEDGVTLKSISSDSTAIVDCQKYDLVKASMPSIHQDRKIITDSIKLSIDLPSGKSKTSIKFSDLLTSSDGRSYKEFFGEKMSEDEAKKVFREKPVSFSKDKNGNSVPFLIEQYSRGYSIKGSLELKNVYVETTVSANNINNSYVKFNAEFNTDLSVEGKLEGKEKIATFTIPIKAIEYSSPITGKQRSLGLYVDVDAYLYVDANLKLQVGFDVKHVTKVLYRDFQLTRTQKTDFNPYASFSGKIETGVGADVLLWFGSKNYRKQAIHMFDIGTKAFANVEADITAHTSYTSENKMLCFDVSGKFPTVTLEIGHTDKFEKDSLLQSIVGKQTFTLYDPKYKPILHQEFDGTSSNWKTVKSCTWNEDDSSDTNPFGESSPSTPRPSDQPSAQSPKYVVRMEDIVHTDGTCSIGIYAMRFLEPDIYVLHSYYDQNVYNFGAYSRSWSEDEYFSECSQDVFKDKISFVYPFDQPPTFVFFDPENPSEKINLSTDFGKLNIFYFDNITIYYPDSSEGSDRWNNVVSQLEQLGVTCIPMVMSDRILNSCVPK